MNSRPKYNTKQKDTLLKYLETKLGVHVTAGDVWQYFKEQGDPIGQATIYRRLEDLVDEGVVNKYVIDGSSSACFEYVGKSSHDEKEVCYHCKCEKCGKLIHLHCDEIKMIQEHLFKEHGFTMDPVRTVFYGICEECGKTQD